MGQRYVLYKSADLDLTEDKRQELIERGVKFLYISDDDAGSGLGTATYVILSVIG